jgi:hypothetical protein
MKTGVNSENTSAFLENAFIFSQNTSDISQKKLQIIMSLKKY